MRVTIVFKTKKRLIDFLSSNQTAESLLLKKKYDEIIKKESLYGTRPANHVFTANFKYDGVPYSVRVEHIYTYPNFEKKYGKMDSLTIVNLRKYPHMETFATFYYVQQEWDDVWQEISKNK